MGSDSRSRLLRSPSSVGLESLGKDEKGRVVMERVVARKGWMGRGKRFVGPYGLGRRSDEPRRRRKGCCNAMVKMRFSEVDTESCENLGMEKLDVAQHSTMWRICGAASSSLR